MLVQAGNAAGAGAVISVLHARKQAAQAGLVVGDVVISINSRVFGPGDEIFEIREALLGVRGDFVLVGVSRAATNAGIHCK